MASIFGDFHEAQRVGSGQLLATTLAPVNDEQDPRRLESFSQLSNHQSIAADVRYHLTQDRSIPVKLSKAEANAWTEIFTNLWTSIREIVSIEKGDPHANWSNAFNAYDKMCNRLIRGYTHDGFQAWTVPCLTATGKQLRLLAMKADAERSKESGGFATDFGEEPAATNEEHAKLQTAAWTINRMFAICLNDRSDLSESRRWGLYSTTNLLFQAYFQLGSISLCKNVLKAINAQTNDIPPLHLFPKSHRCTFQYYRGLISFLEEAYEDAEQRLTAAYSLCHPAAHHNREQILTYLIATRILTSRQLPSSNLLYRHPNLESLFSPIRTAILQGSLSSFDAALASSERILIKKRIYLPLERSRDLVLRNLYRRVFLAGGFEDTTKSDVTTAATTATTTLAETDRSKVRRTRIPIIEFEAAMRISLLNVADYKYADGVEIPDRDEVECLIAGLIYKNLMKGYIARDRGIVVLSKTGAFPGTSI